MTWVAGQHGEFWTAERIDTLTKLWAEGWSASQIAKEIGAASRSAICGKAHRLHLPPRSKDMMDAAAAHQHRRGRSSPKPKADKPKKPANWSIAGRGESKPPTPLKPRQELHATLTIDGLHSHACRWPIGDPLEQGFGFCGRHREIGDPYCEDHLKVAYQVRRPRTEAEKRGDEARRLKMLARAA